jgi:tryptophan synthase alpha chain
MSRISQAFAKKQAFIGYLTAGDSSKEHFLSLIEMGVNVLEIGIPFSDPVADGPVIQKAMVRSLRAGTTPKKVLQLVAELRKETEVAIVLFTYFNPIQRDLKGFLAQAKKAGADGVLVVDLPLEESAPYQLLCKDFGLSPIFVIAPSTPPERIRAISDAAKGFIYYACRKGTTGARSSLPEDLSEKIAQIRTHTDLPIVVGFGISSRETANAVLKIADGFVVGSHFVEGKTL